jgi:putative tricarboxylic transport membrane protein
VTTTHEPPATEPGAEPGAGPGPDLAQLGLAAVLALAGGYAVYDATTLDIGFADPIGPRLFPYVVGTVLVGLAALLVVATFRGDRPEADEGEDVDVTTRADWATVAKLIGVMAFTIATVNLLGWAITGAVLFAGAAWALGSQTLIRDVIVGIVISVGSWYGFYVGLGIPLTPGILDGIL